MGKITPAPQSDQPNDTQIEETMSFLEDILGIKREDGATPELEVRAEILKTAVSEAAVFPNGYGRQPPAVRTGMFRLSWGSRVRVERSGKTYRAVSAVESRIKVGKHLLGDILEDGTKRIKPRPYKQAVIDRAMPKIKEIYNKPYRLP